MRVGFTGTRRGMSDSQKNEFRELITKLDRVRGNMLEFHHGDCVGADAEAHKIVRSVFGPYGRDGGVRIVGHPPDIETSRAFCDFDEVQPALPYLDRNKAIVDECDVLIATPSGPEQHRSGTWSTVRYALKVGKTTIIIGR